MNQYPAGKSFRRSDHLKPSLRLFVQEGRPGNLYRAGAPLRGERQGSFSASHSREGGFGLTQDELEELMDFVCSEVDIVDEIMDRFADLRLINRAWKILEQLPYEELLQALDAHLSNRHFQEGTQLS